MRTRSWRLLALAGLLFAVAGPAPAAEGKKPNVLVFLSDDVGYGEYGFQGGKDIPTPNIDSIAKNGVRFTQGYVCGPYCSPTRAGPDDGPLPDALRPRVQQRRATTAACR